MRNFEKRSSTAALKGLLRCYHPRLPLALAFRAPAAHSMGITFRGAVAEVELGLVASDQLHGYLNPRESERIDQAIMDECLRLAVEQPA